MVSGEGRDGGRFAAKLLGARQWILTGVSRGVQIITDLAVDPAGNVWVANNWDQPDQGFKNVPDPALSTRFGGDGFVVFFGLAKPVHTPLIGPNQPPKAVQ